MQKRFFSLVLGLFSALLALAQPVLTNCEKYAVGQSAFFKNFVPGAIQPGAGGANMAWNFSQTAQAADTLKIKIEHPSNFPAAGPFAPSDVVVSLGNQEFSFEKITPTGNQVVGFIQPAAGLSVAYPNPWQRAARPLAFGQNVSDTLTRAYTNTGLNFSGKGVCNIIADAHGTLKLPNGTTANVMRVRLDQLNFDTAVGVGAVVRVHFMSWAWYTADGVFPLLRIDSQSVTSPFFNNFSKSAFYQVGGTSSTGNVHRLEGHFRAFDSGGRLALAGDFDASKIYRAELFEVATGRKIGESEAQSSPEGNYLTTSLPLPPKPSICAVRVSQGGRSQSVLAVF